jgi:hypothetical protein
MDPAIRVPTPPSQGAMPIICPPGTTGGDQTVVMPKYSGATKRFAEGGEITAIALAQGIKASRQDGSSHEMMIP